MASQGRNHFSGPGRRLDTGEVIARTGEVIAGTGEAKDEVKDDDPRDRTYEPSDAGEEEDSHSDELVVRDRDSEAEEDIEEFDGDFVEVQQDNGTWLKIKKAAEGTDDAMKSKIEQDERFARNAKRGGRRLAIVIKRYSHDDKTPAGKEFDCSDEAIAKETASGPQAVKFVICKTGSFKEEKSKSGRARYAPYTPEEMKAMDDTAGPGVDEPCTCEICAARRKNTAAMQPAGTNRSGKVRDKGHTLRAMGGGDEDEHKDKKRRT